MEAEAEWHKRIGSKWTTACGHRISLLFSSETDNHPLFRVGGCMWYDTSKVKWVSEWVSSLDCRSFAFRGQDKMLVESGGGGPVFMSFWRTRKGFSTGDVFQGMNERLRGNNENSFRGIPHRRLFQSTSVFISSITIRDLSSMLY